ncbi:unnamed protein product [Spirodela intermedia]|uniref:Uncharacterized protein n=2 Tax=Spirodela intermedia TaxID=51605 RepID=A0A7I8LJN0_SPIIN|nr:unnamed protein product [Spirodela intermedia]CAA6672743.1 unnamed protein product [Spirodela intermedia]CAA6674984.1 unnamed protein product [Spirodela intermedia]CAA7409970.1 unnamed protein product [Spirodela intermedia]
MCTLAPRPSMVLWLFTSSSSFSLMIMSPAKTIHSGSSCTAA